MTKKYTATFRIQEDYRKAMKDVVEKTYGKRGKSKWICEAITVLLKKDDFLELVQLDITPTNLCDYPEQFTVPQEMRNLLDKKIIESRRQCPQLEGVQSAIIRTAVIQRLLRE